MGHTVVMNAGACFELLAKNALPVTWLPLFAPEDRTGVSRQHSGESWMAQVFHTSRDIAGQRLDWAISQCRANAAVWQFLRPMETIRAELMACGPEDAVELDITGFLAAVETNGQCVEDGPRAFREMVRGFCGVPEADLLALETLVNGLRHGRPRPLRELGAWDRTRLFFGNFFAANVHLANTPWRFFNQAYWLGETAPGTEC